MTQKIQLTWCLALGISACTAAPTSSPPATPSNAVAPTSSQNAAPVAPLLASPASAPVTAKLEARSGSKASGTVTLSAAEQGVHVKVEVSDVSPGAHGLHFHENGDCSAPDAMSAKGHYNPMNHPHGLPGVDNRHLGDLGNIQVGPDGKGTLEFLLNGASLEPNAPNSLRGRAVILHEKTDDGGQPTGNAGGRIGCAVVP